MQYTVRADTLKFEADDEAHAIEQYINALEGGGYVTATEESN